MEGARKLMLFAKYTTFDKAGFELNVTGPGLIGLVITNTLIKIISLGVLGPVTQARTFKYFVDRMRMHGTIDFHRIAQSQQARGSVGGRDPGDGERAMSGRPSQRRESRATPSTERRPAVGRRP